MRNPTLYDSQGRPLGLGRSLGRGGEGEVWEISPEKDLVAKLYHRPLSPEHAEKVRTMVRLKTEALTRVSAWPLDTCHRRPGGEVVGLVMPKIAGHQAIHELYSPKSRLIGFPDATWSFLLRAASNLARAFAVVHQHGHLVGDVNHGNVLVSRQATVRLIDCDSFQVQADGRTFLCEMGVSTHVPPELQGGSLRVPRAVDHDAFGLAVLIFQILFLGRHPYSGRFQGAGEMPIERAIREHRFAYGPSAGLRQMLQPPNTLDLTAASKPIADLFLRAFAPPAPGSHRPPAHDWAAALDAVRTSACRHNPGHLYWDGLASCPWCALEARAGTVFFYVAAISVPGRGFDLMAAWGRIEAVAPPKPPPAIPEPADFLPPPSAEARAASRKRLLQAGSLGAVVIGSLLAGYSDSTFFIPLLAIVLAIAIRTVPYRAQKEAKQRLAASRSDFRNLRQIWMREAGNGVFRAKRGELEAMRDEYRDLPAFRRRRLAALDAGRRAAQLARFLDQHRIDRAKIPSIGPGRAATLHSYGIETADDLEAPKILQVPGFGPALCQALLSWRRSIEGRFAFDATKPVDPADLAALDRAITARQGEIERALQAGGVDLERIQHQVTLRRQSLLHQLETAAKAVAQGEADLGVL